MKNKGRGMRHHFPVLSILKHCSKFVIAVAMSSYWRALMPNLPNFCAFCRASADRPLAEGAGSVD